MSNGLHLLEFKKRHFEEVKSNEDDDCVLIALSLAFNKTKDEILYNLNNFKNNVLESEADITNEEVWGSYLLFNNYELITFSENTQERERYIINLINNIDSYNYKIIIREYMHILFLSNGKIYDKKENFSNRRVLYYYRKKED